MQNSLYEVREKKAFSMGDLPTPVGKEQHGAIPFLCLGKTENNTSHIFIKNFVRYFVNIMQTVLTKLEKRKADINLHVNNSNSVTVSTTTSHTDISFNTHN